VVTNTAEILGISLSFWTPGWVNVTLSFSWPFNLRWPQQITLAVSVGAIGVEQTMFIWNYLYFWAYGPRHSNAYGGWNPGKHRHNDPENKLVVGVGVDFDLEAGTATGAVDLAVGEEQTSFEAAVAIEGEGGDGEEPVATGDLESALGHLGRSKSSKSLDTQDHPASLASLKAENERLQGENAGLQGENEGLRKQLKTAADARSSSLFGCGGLDCPV
jgi:hypothetical protein